MGLLELIDLVVALTASPSLVTLSKLMTTCRQILRGHPLALLH